MGLQPITWFFGPITIQFMDDLILPQGSYPKSFFVDIFIGSVSGMGGQEGGYLVDIGVSLSEIQRTESSLR